MNTSSTVEASLFITKAKTPSEVPVKEMERWGELDGENRFITKEVLQKTIRTFFGRVWCWSGFKIKPDKRSRTEAIKLLSRDYRRFSKSRTASPYRLGSIFLQRS